MSGDPKSLKDALRKFIDAMPEDDELGEKPLPKGPEPTTYDGRPNGCGGASLVDGTDPETGLRKFRRRRCENECAPGSGLCFDCGRAEKNMRQDLRAEKTNRQRQGGTPSRRGFGEDAK